MTRWSRKAYCLDNVLQLNSPTEMFQQWCIDIMLEMIRAGSKKSLRDRNLPHLQPEQAGSRLRPCLTVNNCLPFTSQGRKIERECAALNMAGLQNLVYIPWMHSIGKAHIKMGRLALSRECVQACLTQAAKSVWVIAPSGQQQHRTTDVSHKTIA